MNLLEFIFKSITKDKPFKYEREDSCLKCLEEKATELHTLLDHANGSFIDRYYHLETDINGSKKDNKYILKVHITEYAKSEQKHKENSHKQEINI